MKVPFLDLKAQYLSIKPEIDLAIEAVINENAFIGGTYVDEFCKNFAKASGAKHCVGVGNGTDAIFITLKMLGIGAGDEVITVANTWISTAETITIAGAKPVFVDIEPDFYNIDAKKIEEKITAKTKAIIPVHLYGQPADMQEIKKIAGRHNLYIIEDCAQAHLAEIGGQKIGTFGSAGTFSFYPSKNLGAYGDGGCIITDNYEIKEKVKMFANHGGLKKHSHQFPGVNSRLDGLQGAILNAKLYHLADWTEARIAKADYYNKILQDIKDVTLPKTRAGAKHVYHLYVIRASRRDQLKKYLDENGIQTGIHYPSPLPFLPAYKNLNLSQKDFPVANLYKDEILSLPIYPEMETAAQDFVAQKIKDFFQ